MAYQGLGNYGDALISYAEGLAADPKLMPALSGLADCMLQSPFRGILLVVRDVATDLTVSLSLQVISVPSMRSLRV